MSDEENAPAKQCFATMGGWHAQELGVAAVASMRSGGASATPLDGQALEHEKLCVLEEQTSMHCAEVERGTLERMGSSQTRLLCSL